MSEPIENSESKTENSPGPSLGDRLAALQAQQATERAAAMVSPTLTIAPGLDLPPITLATWSRLVAFSSPFVTGGPITFTDLANYLWIHHPRFGQPLDRATTRAKRDLTRRLHRYLEPRWPHLEAALRLWSLHPKFPRWLRRRLGPNRGQRQADLIATIRQHIAAAWGDNPRATSADDGTPLPCAREAYIKNLFRRELGLSFAETAALPLAQIVQHERALLVAHKGPHDLALLTREEEQIWIEADH